MTYYYKPHISMEYIFTQISLLFSALVLSFGALVGVATEMPTPTNYSVGTTTAQVIKVIDGDTIDVVVEGVTESIRVRYIGIDTPEPYANEIPECGSADATTRNQELVAGQMITLVPGVEPYDRYNRLLAYVYVGDIFVNEKLVAEGYANVLMLEPNTRYKKQFIALYERAQLDQKGIWAVCE
jgi:micrococcal nuclease